MEIRDVAVKVPSGHEVVIGPRFGALTLAVDLEYAGKNEVEQEWKWAEMLARRIKTIDGKPVPSYNRSRLVADFLERDLMVLTAVVRQMDVPTPDELAAAMAGLVAKETLEECVLLAQMSGGAVSFEAAMQLPEKQRKLMIAALTGKVETKAGAEAEK